MKKIINLILSILLSIGVVSYNSSKIMAIDEEKQNGEEYSEIVNENSDESTENSIIELETENEFVDNNLEESEDILENEDNIIDEQQNEPEESENAFEFVPGVIDIDVDIDRYLVKESKKEANLLKGSEVIPSKYNLAKEGYITSVKNQGNYGSCWAHAILASAESTSIMDGEADINIDLSEVNLNYFEYNNQYADLLELITNDYSVCDNTGDGDDCVFNCGGNLGLAMMNLPSGIGISYESRLPYSTLNINRKNFKINTFENTYINGHDDWCYVNDFLVVNVNSYNLSQKDEVKKALMNEGAIGVSYYHDDKYFSSTYNSYNNDVTKSTNHAVTLVGWDDNFSKENFVTGHKPKSNGAWIIKNSWDTDWGDDGYFYISYEDKGLNSALGYLFDIEQYNQDDRIYQYDGTFCDWEKYSYSTVHYEANNYVAQRDEYINRIGFYTTASDVDYTVYIYKNNTSMDHPTSGTKVVEVSGSERYGGYHSIKLDTPAFLNEGDKFSVVVKLSGNGSEYFYLDQTISYSSYWYNTHSDYSLQQSYFSINGSSWEEMSNSTNGGNLRVKGYSNSTLLNSDNTYVTYSEDNGLYIHSENTSLINAISSITIDETTVTGSKTNSKNILINNADLIKSEIGNGQHSITIKTSDGFKKTFTTSFTLPLIVDGDIYLGFTSDIHNDSSNTSATRLNNWINNISDKLSNKFVNFVSLGDMGAKTSGTSAEENYWIYSNKAVDVIKNNKNIIRTGFNVLGDYEWSVGNYKTTTNTVKNNYSLNGTIYEDSLADYVFYSFGADDNISSEKEYCILQEDVDKLDEYLQNAPKDKPLFILSHYPLHSYSDIKIDGAGEAIEILNKYSYDHTIIFLWGHSHSQYGNGESHYDVISTKQITNYDNKGENIDINFVYASGGCMSDSENSNASANVKAKGLVAKVEDSKVILTYYDKDYKVVGDSVEVDYQDGTKLPTKYTITFDGNEGSCDITSKDVIKNSTYGKLPVPSRLGYDFAGWYTQATGGDLITPDSKVDITSNKTLYAHWNIAKYTITFDSNGGDSLSTSSKQVTHGQLYGDLPTPTRTGYDFVGWFTSKDNENEVKATDIVSITDDQTLYAHWTIKKYTITLDADGGTLSSNTIQVEHDGKYGTLPTPTKTGYNFAGWYSTKAGTTKIYSSTKIIKNEDHTLYAIWNAKTIKVTLNANGGSFASGAKTSYNILYNSNYSVNSYPTPTKTGYEFVGWYTDKTGGTNITSSSLVSNGSNHTLYAHWSAIVYKVTLDVNGGNSLSQDYINVQYNGKYANLPTPTRTGYNFTGWYNEAGTTKVIDGTSILTNANHKLVAKWSANTYTVSFDTNGGDSLATSSKQVTYDKTYGNLPTPIRTGYEFVGWFTSKDSGSKVESTSIVSITDSQTLYAHWSAITYTISFDGNGGTGNMSNQTFTYDVAKTLTNNSYTKTGYDFAGWTYNDNTYTNQQLISNLTTVKNTTIVLKAKWIAKEITVTFDTNGGNTTNPKTKVVTYDETYGDLPTPTRDNYTFAGWYTDKTGGTNITSSSLVSNEKNHSLYAHWSAVQATLTSIEVDCPQIIYPKKATSLCSDLKVSAVYSNGTKTDVTKNSTITIPSMTTTGTKTVKVEYGDFTKEFNIYVFGANTATLTLEGRVIVDYKAVFPEYVTLGYTPGALFFQQDNSPSDSEIKTAYNNNEGVTNFDIGDNCLIFHYNQLTAKELGDTIYMVLYAKTDKGVIYGSPIKYGVMNYVSRAFSTSDTSLKTLLSDMLNYSAAAQKYFGYKTDNLANAGISGGTTTNPSISKHMATHSDSLTSDTVKIASASISLENEIFINLTSNVEYSEDIEEAKLLVFDSYIDGGNYNKSNSKNMYDMETKASGNKTIYYGRIPNIVAKDMRRMYHARIYIKYKNGTEYYSKILSYSVEDYAYQVINTTGSQSNLLELKKLVKEMMKYGDSAKNYLSN